MITRNTKFNRILFLIIMIITFLIVGLRVGQAQDNVSVSIYQDARLLITGDDIGNDAGTINMVFRLKMQGNQNKYGYLVVFPEYEYAEIKNIYKRYSVGVGYSFNQLILDNFEFTPSASYGWIDRGGVNGFSFGLNAELSYKLNDTLKLSIMAQGTERKDLKILYNDNDFRFSGFIGLEINLK